MSANRWVALIDDAAALCGSQSALALRIGAPKQLVSLAKQGGGRLNDEQLAKLGELLGRDPAELWDLQELANMPRRNPFAKGLTAGIAAFFLVNLSGFFWPENVRLSSTCASVPDESGNAHCRLYGGRLRLLLALMFRGRRPIAGAC